MMGVATHDLFMLYATLGAVGFVFMAVKAVFADSDKERRISARLALASLVWPLALILGAVYAVLYALYWLVKAAK